MFNLLLLKWHQSPITKALSTLVSGQILAQTILLFATPIISRIYDIASFGQFSILTSTASIISSFSLLGLSSAIMIPEDEQKAKHVLTSAVWVQFLFITLIAFAAITLKPYFQFFDLGVPYSIAILLLFIHSVLINLINLLSIYMNRNKLYRVLFWNAIISATTTLCITIPLGYAGAGFWGFVSASIVSSVICCAQMIHKTNPLVRISWARGVKIISEYKDFVLYQYPANSVGTLALQLPNQMLDMSFGSEALGSYSMSNKIFRMPISLIAAPINTVYFKTMVDFKREGKDLAGFTFSLVSKIMLVAFVPLVILIAFGDVIFAFVLGNQWGEAGSIAAILGLQYVLAFCGICTSYCRVSIGRQGMNLMMSIVHLTVITAALLIGIYVFTGLKPTIVCFAIGNSLYQLLNMVVNFYCLGKCMLKYLFFSLSYCLVSVGTGFLLRLLINA